MERLFGKSSQRWLHLGSPGASGVDAARANHKRLRWSERVVKRRSYSNSLSDLMQLVSDRS